MELKEFIAIFRKNGRLFIGIVLFALVAAFVWQRSQPVSYQATLLLNVGRSGAQETTEYTYDGFYRLQADERFADTVVRWLQSPRVVEDIYADARLDVGAADIRDLKGAFKAGRLSSQMIEVGFTGRSEKTLRVLSESSASVLNRYAESLNRDNQEKNWFVIIGSDPVIRDGRVALPLALVVGLLAGLFVAFWAVLIRHYFSRE